MKKNSKAKGSDLVKISSDTHKILQFSRSFLFHSKDKNYCRDLMDHKHDIRIITTKDRFFFDMDVEWLMARGYSCVIGRSAFNMGIPTIQECDIHEKKFILDSKSDGEFWICDCPTNPIHFRHEGAISENCQFCGTSPHKHKIDSLFKTTEDLWGTWEAPFFDLAEKSFRNGEGKVLSTEFLLEKYRWSKDRSIIYRMPPQNIIELMMHTFRGTIFSFFKPLTKQELENDFIVKSL